MNKVRVKCDWYFYDQGGRLLQGPLSNWVTSAGLAAIAALLEGVSSPYLVIGDDTTAGETITETYRQAVSSVTRDGPIVRFRTQLLAGDGNGDHQKACIYTGASAVPGTGTMLNLLVAPWSKTSAMILTVEARFSLANG